MRKALILVFAAVLTFAATGTASAASAKPPQPVNVAIDGKAIAFGEAPTIIDNKTYVEAEELLKTLGYEAEVEAEEGVVYVYATSEDREIQLSTADNGTFVNGTPVSAPGELVAQDERLLLGLRFIATVSGYSVGWDKPTRTASLAYEGPNEAERTALYATFNKLQLLEAAGDATGLASLFAPDAQVDVKALQDEWTKTKTRTTFHKKRVEYYSDGVAVVTVNDETVKLSGKFFPDNTTVTRYTLEKAENGEWLIYAIETLSAEVKSVSGLFDQAVAIPDAEKTAIGAMLDAQVKANNEKDVDGFLATLSEPSLHEQVRQELEQMYAVLDSVATVEKWAIVEYDGANEALLLATIVTDVTMNGQRTKMRVTLTNEAGKAEGKWLLAPQTMTLHSEQL